MNIYQRKIRNKNLSVLKATQYGGRKLLDKIVHSNSVTQYPIVIMKWDKIQTNAFITEATSPALN